MSADFSIHEFGEHAEIVETSLFLEAVRKERRLADRIGEEFSLILFSKTEECKEELLSEILARTRSADLVGWYDRDRIGVLLPATGADGAWKFVHDVGGGAEGSGVRPEAQVLCYPETLDAPDARERAVDREFSPAKEELLEVFVRKIPVWKRVLDIAGALTALILSSPIMIVTALWIKLVSKGPVFFRQKRVGYKGRLFDFLKFRTMKVGNDTSSHQAHLRELIASEKPMEKLDNRKDPRIIPGGNVIRKLSIDELPQFFNVLRGEMSMVGPRPCIPYEAAEYRQWHTHRFDVLPGMSGLWQVSGKNRLSFKEMIRLDITYAERMSLGLDLKIIALTIPTIIGMALEGGADKKRAGSGSPKLEGS